MKLWILIPGKPSEQIEASNPIEKAREIINNTMDFTKVVYKGKRCTMAVDDCGMINDLPVNHATLTYDLCDKCLGQMEATVLNMARHIGAAQ